MIKTAVAITFHWTQERLCYLRKTCEGLIGLSDVVDLYIFTNTQNESELAQIRSCACDSVAMQVISPTFLGHPFFLTWAHKSLFKRLLLTDSSITHFLYLEDDINFLRQHMDYFLEYREPLSKYRLIPGFLRYETASTGQTVLTDIPSPQDIHRCPSVRVQNSLFVTLSRPYQGMYLFDRVLAEEYFSRKHPPALAPWGIREMAASGLTWEHPPEGFISRIAIGCDFQSMHGGYVPKSSALVHHLPSNYADNPNSKFGKLRIERLFG